MNNYFVIQPSGELSWMGNVPDTLRDQMLDNDPGLQFIPTSVGEQESLKYSVVDGEIVKDIGYAIDQRIGNVKTLAQELIAETTWRLERAQERAKIGASGETVAQVMAEREAIRAASNRAELEIEALDDLEAIMDFTWEVTEADYPVSALVTRLAFLSRFTNAEAVAIDLASIGETVEAASVRRYVSKIEAASFIDLSREDTRSGVQALEGLGILVAGRALEILDAPIQPDEVPQ